MAYEAATWLESPVLIATVAAVAAELVAASCCRMAAEVGLDTLDMLTKMPPASIDPTSLASNGYQILNK